jgi:hypothetical protein
MSRAASLRPTAARGFAGITSSAANPLKSRSICFLTVRKDESTQRLVRFIQ